MAFLSWEPEYSVGVTELDQQHRRLVEIINEVHDVMAVGAPKTALLKVATGLLGYARYHFTYEEKLLARACYADIDSRRRTHAAIAAQMERFVADVRNSNAPVPTGRLAFLTDWLPRHILATGMR